MKLVKLLFLLFFSTVFLIACRENKKEEVRKIQIGFTTAAIDSDPYYIFAKNFSEIVDKKTNGRIKIEVKGGGQLGQEGEMFTGMQIGTTDMAVMTNAYVSGYIPAAGLFDLPFIFKNNEEAARILDGKLGIEVLNEYEKFGIKALAYGEGGFRHLVTLKNQVKKPEDFKGLKIRCMPPSWLAEEMIDGFLVEDYSKTSNIIEVTCRDHEKERGKDMLTTLIREYNKDAGSFRRTENMKLLTFIDGRIHHIMAELQQVEANIEGYKTKNRMTLLESDVMFYAEQMKELQVKIIEVEAESQVIKMMDDYIKNPNNKYNVIPSLLSADGEKGGAISVYNEAIVERNRLLKNSNEKNPAFRSVSDQVDKLREGVYQMIDNSKKGYQIVLQDLKGKEKQLLDKMRSVPALEREYVDFKRQQEILQGVYLILLQKREEIELAIGQQTERARVVDKAYMLQKSVGPRKLYAAIAILVLTLIIPVTWIECRDIYASIKEEYRRGDKTDQ